MQYSNNQSQHTFYKIVFQVIEKYTYKQNCEIYTNTATLLIHNLKYLSLVSLCFTKGKKRGRV